MIPFPLASEDVERINSWPYCEALQELIEFMRRSPLFVPDVERRTVPMRFVKSSWSGVEDSDIHAAPQIQELTHNKNPFKHDSELSITAALNRIADHWVAAWVATVNPPHKKPPKWAIMKLESWFSSIIIPERMYFGVRDHLCSQVFEIFRNGYVPLRSRGRHPNGFWDVWCPASYPQANRVPESCQPTPEQLATGTGQRRAKMIVVPPYDDIPIVDPGDVWGEVAFRGSGSLQDRVRDHLSVWARTDACRNALDQIASKVKSVEVNATLDITFHGPAGRDDYLLSLAPPYGGKLPRIPRSLAEAIRTHNGASLTGFSFCTWYPMVNGQFQSDGKSWYTHEPDDPENPLPEHPFIPIDNEAAAWALNPRESFAPGEWAACCLDGNDIHGPFPFGIGGVWLRLLRYYIIGDDDQSYLYAPRDMKWTS